MGKNTKGDFEAVKQVIENLSNRQEKKAELDKNSNIFCILGVDDFEIRHSNFLEWLFRTNKKFLKSFLTCKEGLSLDEDDTKNLVNSEYEITREYKENLHGRSVDIVISFPKVKWVIVIENKIYSSEGENQLSDYYNYIENSPKFKGFERKYIYLTLGGQKPSSVDDNIHYVSMSYSSILEILEKIKTTRKNLRAQDIFVNNYIDILKDKTVKVMNRVDDYLELYRNHKDVVLEMISYIPNPEKRVEIEKEIINNNPDLILKSDMANVFVVFFNNKVCNFALENGFTKDWIEFGFNNDLNSNNQMSFYLTISKDKENKFKKFIEDFRKEFDRKDKSKDGASYVTFSERLLASNKKNGYLTEEEFQNKIREIITNLFEDKDSIYNRYVKFILNYKFD